MYKITFVDGTTFEGGEFYDSHWNDIDDKPIKNIDYRIQGHKIYISGYTEYNHVVERVFLPQYGIDRPHLIKLMVRKGDEVLIIAYNLINNRFRGDIKVYGKEYRGKPHTGWKLGFVTKSQAITID